MFYWLAPSVKAMNKLFVILFNSVLYFTDDYLWLTDSFILVLFMEKLLKKLLFVALSQEANGKNKRLAILFC